MPIRNPGRYPIHIAVTPSTHPDRFQGKYAGRESRFLYGISGIAEFPERLPGHKFMDCVYQDLHNAEGEYIFLTVDHLDPQNSAVLPRLQQLRSLPTEPPDNITDPVSRLRQTRDLDPAAPDPGPGPGHGRRTAPPLRPVLRRLPAGGRTGPRPTGKGCRPGPPAGADRRRPGNSRPILNQPAEPGERSGFRHAHPQTGTLSLSSYLRA